MIGFDEFLLVGKSIIIGGSCLYRVVKDSFFKEVIFVLIFGVYMS